MHRLAIVPPLLRVPPWAIRATIRISELPLQRKCTRRARVRVVAVHGWVTRVHIRVGASDILAALLGGLCGLVGPGLAYGGCGIAADCWEGDSGCANGLLAEDGCALGDTEGAEGGRHCDGGGGVGGAEMLTALNACPGAATNALTHET